MKKLLYLILPFFLFTGCQSGTEVIIKVTEPLPASDVESPIIIKGEAKGMYFFEGTFSVYLVDNNGNTISNTNATSLSDWMTEDFVPFEATLEYEIETDNINATIIFEAANPSGLPENEMSFEVPVVLKKTEVQNPTTTFSIYFSNTITDPEMLDCSNVYPVSRTVPETQQVAEAALLELLKGPTAEEESDGFFTSINDNVSLNSIIIKEGVAYADFDSTLGYQVGGSCKVINIRSQIEQTLLQFDSVNEVVIQIDGESEDILQP